MQRSINNLDIAKDRRSGLLRKVGGVVLAASLISSATSYVHAQGDESKKGHSVILTWKKPTIANTNYSGVYYIYYDKYVQTTDVVYNVYRANVQSRSESCNGFRKINDQPVAATTYVDSMVKKGKSYCYATTSMNKIMVNYYHFPLKKRESLLDPSNYIFYPAAVFLDYLWLPFANANFAYVGPSFEIDYSKPIYDGSKVTYSTESEKSNIKLVRIPKK